MAVNLFDGYKQSSSADLKNTDLSKIYIFDSSDGHHTSKKYVPVSELVVYVDDSTTRKVKNLNDLYKAISESKLYFTDVNGNRDLNNRIKLASKSIKFFVQDLNVPNAIDSISINGIKADKSEDKVEYGLKRRVEMKAQSNSTNIEEINLLPEDEKTKLYNDSDFLFVTLHDGSSKYVRKEDLGTFVGINFKSIKDNTSIKRIEDLKGKDIYLQQGTHTDLVTGIYFNGFKVGKVTHRESLDLENRVKNTYSVNGNDVAERKEKIDAFYSEQIFVSGKEPKLEITNFTLDKSGRFIKVRFAGEVNETMVALPLYNDSQAKDSQIVPVEKLREYVGRSLYVKYGDSVQQLEPLTIEQAEMLFSSIKTMSETTLESDIMQDGTYIKLKNGKYVEENKAVRPMGYEYLPPEADSDKYIAKCQNASGEVFMIISKEDIIRGKNVDGYKILKEDAHPIRLSTKDFTECDVIQTSNCPNINKLERCKVLSEYPYNAEPVPENPASEEDRRKQKLEDIKNAVDEFNIAYKAGKYHIDDVIVEENGVRKFEKVAENGKRYKITDKQLVDAPFAQTSQYKNIDTHDLTFDGKKIKGWGHHKAGKEIKLFYMQVAGRLPQVFSWNGLVTAAVVATLIGNPAVVIGLLSAIGAGVVLAPAIIAIKCKIQNSFKSRLKDPNKLNKKACEKQFTNDLADLLEQTKTNKNRNELSFLDHISNLEQKLYNMSSVHFNADFTMKDGKAVVNAGNAKLCDDYKEEISRIKKEIKKYKNLAKTDKEASEKLQALKDRLDTIKHNYHSQNHASLSDKHFEEKLEQLQIAKGYALFKHFGKGKDLTDIEMANEYDFDLNEAGISAEEEFLKDYEFDVKKGEFVYVGKKKLSKKEKADAKVKLDSLKEKFKTISKNYKTTRTSKEEIISDRVEQNVAKESYKEKLQALQAEQQNEVEAEEEQIHEVEKTHEAEAEAEQTQEESNGNNLTNQNNNRNNEEIGETEEINVLMERLTDCRKAMHALALKENTEKIDKEYIKLLIEAYKSWIKLDKGMRYSKYKKFKTDEITLSHRAICEQLAERQKKNLNYINLSAKSKKSLVEVSNEFATCSNKSFGNIESISTIEF